MGEKLIVIIIIIICSLLLGMAIAQVPKVKAEKLPEVVEPTPRMKLVESVSLGNKTNIYMILVNNKEYMIGSNWNGGITIFEVTK